MLPCRFTPADLMVVVKTLTYRQFSYLLSMTSPHVGSVDGSSSELGSSGSRTPLSSMSEVSRWFWGEGDYEVLYGFGVGFFIIVF